MPWNFTGSNRQFLHGNWYLLDSRFLRQVYASVTSYRIRNLSPCNVPLSEPVPTSLTYVHGYLSPIVQELNPVVFAKLRVDEQS
ncbi:hypothetical protein H1P_4040001 [Hyella patelloides LEGE 07179]|uniref:Uncharacterized protein n=1 Tax=Hyella patelloides LEGE 07179 TaxID=945734 RepID=A0A563VXC5_9CYAN|nr:hypothetical protein H1P_4040001 [Hyella patelloides LEGE 07179]